MVNERRSILSPDTSILIIDDCADYAQVLRRILQNGMGYHTVVTISSMDEAYNLIVECPEQFTLLFLDYHFPDGSKGTRLIERLEAEKLMENRVTFFITAEPTVDQAVDATVNGLKGVVIKPFNSEQLRSQIERVERAMRMETQATGK